ncbi:hypothetical protein GT204_08150 [Streptomyces sp. SID4919]|uniref:hypothetical protein n=1 Tax=unclassified Streptomyces TaxID=2593676 RepID=UPI0008239EC0|nr:MULTISPECIES: hypothetical protein [unclassified Streptomyces]MYY08874.1 hypothetical protein [Streptomyces sp. SID4919]SCK26049.1 hypothetical protein YW7DRAFT_02013 [Streptomyces sp. AmelKG-E11A]
MFDRNVEYPCAVTSNDTEGVDAAIDWCCEHMEDGDTLSVWTSLKSNLRKGSQLEQFVSRHSNVEHVTGRGGGFIGREGPVLMAWPDMADIGKLVQHGSHRVRALCVITWNEDEIRPWVTAMKPSPLGDTSAWDELTPALDPVVIEALKSLTTTINHNNTIAAGYEKDMVVGSLLALHDSGIPIDGEAMQGWALAHGWSGKNPERLAKYVNEINAGKRPRSRHVPRPGYVDRLRLQAADNA